MYENIKYEVKGNLGYLTINRPKALNALNTEVLSELADALKEIEADDAVKAVIVTGEGKAFVAGADIAQMSKLNAVEGRAMMQAGHKVMNTIDQMPKPFIAAVNGFALGGGCELAMACDIRIASSKAKFGQPEVGLGIIPGFCGTQRLSRLVGKGMAKYLIYSAEMINAEEAFRIGLVEKVVEPDALMEAAEKLAHHRFQSSDCGRSGEDRHQQRLRYGSEICKPAGGRSYHRLLRLRRPEGRHGRIPGETCSRMEKPLVFPDIIRHTAVSAAILMHQNY